ncbi:Ribonuclease P protein component, mitochondrial [Nakaseomyces bracarensis]|uniref:Ribonuclease P protein component, mitochondrial n=1 Tax=Nakaseomyces bracarensis TaxID=273131 RepID=A0ABR4NV19_9SACH
MAFKSFKYKIYAKGYHHSTTPSTSFFDNGYYYYQHVRSGKSPVGVMNTTQHPPSEDNGLSTTLHPVVVANNNYNNLDHILSLNSHHDSQDDLGIDICGRKTGNRILTSGNRNNGNASGSGTSRSRNVNSAKKNAKKLASLYKKDSFISQKRFVSSRTTQTDKVESLPQLDLAELEREYQWDPDNEEDLNPETYLATHIEQINKHYERNDYNIINALYHSLKRNGIVVRDCDTVYKILVSLSRREMDDLDIDNKVFELLSCYQDMIANKVKPTVEIYNVVLETLFKSSIVAYKNNNGNGTDFYKIGSELFKTVIEKNDIRLSNDVVNFCLLSTNLYPTFMKLETLQNYINQLTNYRKDSFYYIACLHYARMNNDLDTIKELYEEYRQLLVNDKKNISLREDQFKVYSMFVSGLVECGELELASSLLEKFITKIRNEHGSGENLSILLSNFILSVSKLDCNKAYILWSKFNRLSWVPEFSYEFYLTLLHRGFKDWALTKKIYDYIFPMKRAFKKERETLSDFLLYPMGLESVLNSLMDFSLQLMDNQVVLKLIEESLVKQFTFETGLYPFIFTYLKETDCPDDYLLRLIKSHGELILRSEKPEEIFMLFNAIADNFTSQSLRDSLTELDLFVESCRNFNLAESNKVNYQGFLNIFQSIWCAPKTSSNLPKLIQLHAIMVTKLMDFETYPIVENNRSLSEFKETLNGKFMNLCSMYVKLGFDPNNIAEVTCEALRLSNANENLINYFSHPGDWDKSYPLSLGSMIRVSPATGIKEFNKLRSDGYCFDYDTYKSLVIHNAIDNSVIDSILKLLPIDEQEESKDIANAIGNKITNNQQAEYLLHDERSQLYILPYLKDSALLNLAEHCADIYIYMSKIGFPTRFKGIATQAENKDSIAFIYNKLYEIKDYETIISLNKACPVLDLKILLKSFIRTGDYPSFLALFEKYRNEFGPEGLDLQVEFLINKGQIDDALNIIHFSSQRTEKTLDLYSFAKYLKSFSNEIIIDAPPENTLQLANMLSAQNSFSGMLSVYDIVHKSGIIDMNGPNSVLVKTELLAQMLNNLEDALAFFDPIDNQIKEVFAYKVQNLMRFKIFLKSPSLTKTEMIQLIHIWNVVQPQSINALFNNIVESFYLDDKIRILYLQEGITFPFNIGEINVIINEIANCAASRMDQQGLQKANDFKNFMESNYIPTPIKFQEDIKYS